MILNDFNIYVINLKKDKRKWDRIKYYFQNININLIRFNAIDGKNLLENDIIFKRNHITKRCNLTCTDGMIGCGLSHIKLANYILKNDRNDFSVILEDDVRPIVSNFKNEIWKTILNSPKNYDIIKIYYHGACKNPNHPFLLCGSCAGYILSKKGAKKLSNLKLNNHIDWQLQQTSNILVVTSPKILLSENKTDSNIAEKNILSNLDNVKLRGFESISWYLNEPFFKIPYLNINVSFFKFLLLISIIAFIFLKIKGLMLVIFVLCFIFLLYYINRK